MQNREQTINMLNTLTLILSVIIIFSMITLLYINIAIPDANSPPQAVINGSAVEPLEVQPQPPQSMEAEEPQIILESQPEEPETQEQHPEAVQEHKAEHVQFNQVNASRNNMILAVIITVVGGIVVVAGIIIIGRKRIDGGDEPDTEESHSEKVEENITEFEDIEDKEPNNALLIFVNTAIKKITSLTSVKKHNKTVKSKIPHRRSLCSPLNDLTPLFDTYGTAYDLDPSTVPPEVKAQFSKYRHTYKTYKTLLMEEQNTS